MVLTWSCCQKYHSEVMISPPKITMRVLSLNHKTSERLLDSPQVLFHYVNLSGTRMISDLQFILCCQNKIPDAHKPYTEKVYLVHSLLAKLPGAVSCEASYGPWLRVEVLVNSRVIVPNTNQTETTKLALRFLAATSFTLVVAVYRPEQWWERTCALSTVSETVLSKDGCEKKTNLSQGC